MVTTAVRDVILRGSIDGNFHVVDAISRAPIVGPLPLTAALAYARELGARIFQQAVDLRGRAMGEPVRLECREGNAESAQHMLA